MIDISEVSFIDPVCIYPASFALQLLAASMIWPRATTYVYTCSLG